MNRFTTNNPFGNIETALNLFYIKDKETWVRGYGPAPDYGDISLDSFIKNLCKTYSADIDTELDLEEFSEVMAEQLFYGPEDIEGLLAVLYTAGWAFAELRYKLMDYEDSGLTPDQVKRMRWHDAKTDPPKVQGEYLVEYGFFKDGELSDMRFHMISKYYLVDENPHFQDEGTYGLAVTKWMPIPSLLCEDGIGGK